MPLSDVASETNKPTSKKWFKAEVAIIQCPNLRCLAYKDENGNWRNYYSSREMFPVLEIVRALGRRIISVTK